MSPQPPGPPPAPDARPPGESEGEPERGSERGSERRRVGVRVLLVMVGALVAVFAGLYVTAYAVTGSGVPRGTKVLGVDIGGLTVADAEARLEKELPAVTTRTVTVTAAGQTFKLDASSSGLAVDAKETVARAGTRSLAPGSLLPVLFGATERLDPVLAVDEVALAEAVQSIAEKVDQKGREGRIRFVGGQAKATKARDGRALDVAATTAALRRAYETGTSDVTAAVAINKPQVGADAVETAMRDFALPAMAGPVTITLHDKPVVLKPTKLDDYLTMVPADGALRTELDTEALAEDLTEDHPDLVKQPKDASFVFRKLDPTQTTVTPVVVPSEVGEEIDPETLAPRLLLALADAADRTAVADVREAQPDLTTEAAEGLGITEKISSFRTNYPYAAYRVTNIGRAAKLINLSVVRPGETWSLNERVGERTEANGFVKGYVINQGRFAEDLGGGVSQSATTTFNAMFFAGLKDVEHHPHSLYISRYPAGREATVAYGAKDLRFENDSDTGVVIRAIHHVGYIRVEFWGTKHWDKIESVSSPRYNTRTPKTIYSTSAKCEAQIPSNGFDIDVTRVFVKDGKEVRREKFHTSYLATDRIICGPAPALAPKDGKDGADGADGKPVPATTTDAKPPVTDLPPD